MQSLKQKNKKSTPVSFEKACHCYLTDTEIRVVKHVALGYTCHEIALKFGNKESTIQTHRRNIKKKLELKGYRSLERWCGNHMEEILQFENDFL